MITDVQALHPDQAPDALDADIAALDLTPAAFLLAHQTAWDLCRIDRAELSYRCWWQTIRHRPAEAHAPPGPEAEAFAHAHRDACSLRYEQDCRLIFGRTLHHYGLAGLLGPQDRALQQQRYQASRRNNAAMVERVSRDTGWRAHLPHQE